MDAFVAEDPGRLSIPAQPQHTPSGNPAAEPDRLTTLEREIGRLRREMDRLVRLMALFEHDLAVERIVSARAGVWDTLLARLRRWTVWARA